MQISPAAASTGREAPGYVEKAVLWIAQKVMQVIRPVLEWLGWRSQQPSAAPMPQICSPAPPMRQRIFEKNLMDALRQGTVLPSRVLWHFEKIVPAQEKERIYEFLGRRKPQGFMDRIYNVFSRNAQKVASRYREIGRLEAKTDPYLVAHFLYKALQSRS